MEVQHPNTLLSLLHCDVDHGVEVDIVEDERFKGMSSPRLSSRNFSPNSVLIGDLFLYESGLCLGMYGDRIAAGAAAAAAALRGGGVCTRIVKATVSRCGLEDSSSFQRCSNLANHTRDFPRWA